MRYGILFALVAFCGCVTAAPTTTSPDAVRCTREPVGVWAHTPSPYGGEYQFTESGRPTRLSVTLDITPVEKNGAVGSIIVIDTIDHAGVPQRDYIYLPAVSPDYKPLDRIIRCLRGAMERRYEEWKAMMPLGYLPAPPATKGNIKKGGK